METVKSVEELRDRAQAISDSMNDLLVEEAGVVIGMLAAQFIRTFMKIHSPKEAIEWVQVVLKQAGIETMARFIKADDEKVH